MLLSRFTFLQAVAISALNLNGLTPVTAEKIITKFLIKGKTHIQVMMYLGLLFRF